MLFVSSFVSIMIEAFKKNDLNESFQSDPVKFISYEGEFNYLFIGSKGAFD